MSKKIICVFIWQTKWQYEDTGQFEDYSADISYIIERAYQNKDRFVTWKECDGKTMTIYFSKMVERENNNPITDVKVQRKEMNDPGMFILT